MNSFKRAAWIYYVFCKAKRNFQLCVTTCFRRNQCPRAGGLILNADRFIPTFTWLYNTGLTTTDFATWIAADFARVSREGLPAASPGDFPAVRPYAITGIASVSAVHTQHGSCQCMHGHPCRMRVLCNARYVHMVMAEDGTDVIT